MRRMILPASLLLALSSFAMAAPIYKWVDAEGVTHFGAQPPQGAHSREDLPRRGRLRRRL